MVLEARGEATLDNLRQASDTLIYYAGRDRRLNEVSSSLQPEIPQLYFDVDRDQVKLSGVPLADVFSTMKTFTGSVYVNDFNMFNRIYRVYIQAEGTYRAHKRRYQHVLRARHGRSDDTAHRPRHGLLHHGAGGNQAVQHVQLGHHYRRSGTADRAPDRPWR